MKKKFLISCACFAALLLSAVTFVACDSDDLFNTKNTMSDYISITKVGNARYVGKDVIIDLQVKSRKKDINGMQLSFSEVRGSDSQSYYGYSSMSMGEGQPYSPYSIRLSIAEGESQTIRIRVSDASDLKKLYITFRASSNQMGTLEDDTMSFSTDVVDNRGSLSNKVLSNDENLTYSKPVFSKNGNDLYVKFAVTNNTGKDLTKVVIQNNTIYNGSQDVYGYSGISVDGNTPYYYVSFSLNNKASKEITLQVRNYYNNPQYIDAKFNMYAENYTFASNYFWFLSLTGN